MFEFLKTFGQGILYVILSPFLLLAALVFMVYSVFTFFLMFVKRIIMFFSGEDMKEEMRIDKLARMHLENQDSEKKEKESKNEVQATPIIEKQTTVIQQPIIIQTDEEGRIKACHIPNQNINQANVASQPQVMIEKREEAPLEEDEEL